MKKKILFGLTLILGLFILSGCGKELDLSDEIVSFSYSYGSYNNGYYDFRITTEDGKVNFKANGSNGVNLNVDEEIDKSILNDLNKVIKENKIDDWDGFDKNDSEVLDGYSFTLNIEYASGKTVAASGYSDTPKNYDSAHEALSKFLKKIK